MKKYFKTDNMLLQHSLITEQDFEIAKYLVSFHL